MSQFSNFAPFGQFEFSDEPEFLPERMYNAQKSALGPAFAGPNDEAETYADAMCFSAVSEEITAAGAQDDPEQCSYLIDNLLHDYMVPVVTGATLEDKRADLAFAMAAASGSFDTAVMAGLTSILGSLLINWRPMSEQQPSPNEVVSFTLYPMHSPPVETPIKCIEISDRVLPGTQTVAYSRVTDDGNGILVGEKLVVDPGKLGLEEEVTVTWAGAITFTAVFAKVHENAIAVAGPCCTWASNARHSMIIVDPSVLTNAHLLNRVHEFMRKTMPIVSTWIICKESSPGYVGPFKVGDLIGQTPVGVSWGDTAILTTEP